MARRAFFSFHYANDVHRAWIVRNSWVCKVAQANREAAGFFDSSVFESLQRSAPEALKRFLRDGLNNTSVTCVLVGAETCLRRWVRYEIFRSFMCGNGIFAVKIHNISSMNSPPSLEGSNPLEALAFTVNNGRVTFKEFMSNGWQAARDVGSMPLNEVRYDLRGYTNHTFACLFPIYEWISQRGYENLGNWIESAAQQARR